jgi:hypothetical protein
MHLGVAPLPNENAHAWIAQLLGVDMRETGELHEMRINC